MSIEKWSSTISAIVGVGVIVGGIARWILKKYILDVTQTLKELKPNSGSSIKDQVTRLERQHFQLQNEITQSSNAQKEMDRKLDMMYEILIKYIAESK